MKHTETFTFVLSSHTSDTPTGENSSSLHLELEHLFSVERLSKERGRPSFLTSSRSEAISDAGGARKRLASDLQIASQRGSQFEERLRHLSLQVESTGESKRNPHPHRNTRRGRIKPSVTHRLNVDRKKQNKIKLAFQTLET